MLDAFSRAVVSADASTKVRQRHGRPQGICRQRQPSFGRC